MSQAENFLHTTHRTVTWFNKAHVNDDLELSPPFQRNAVWTNAQKSYLIDTILNALPIPELYMQDMGNASGEERHIVVDGQQRIRAVLDYVNNNFSLSGDDVAPRWRGLKFDQLSPDDRKSIFGYKFVVRILPSDLRDEEIRRIFSRINKNTVSLTDQELRNATYWGPFISAIQLMADEDRYWSDCGIFSANDHRRMSDQEFISELAIAYLHGPQNKKDRLDHFYLTYEEDFERRDELVRTFNQVTADIARTLPRLWDTRWRKKSDFYTLFIAFAARAARLPFDQAIIDKLATRIVDFGEAIDTALRVEAEDRSNIDPRILTYANAVARAASDRGSRIARARAFSQYVFEEEPSVLEVGSPGQSKESVAAGFDASEQAN